MQGSTLGCIINRKIIFRADGNANIGFGHVYRMLALIDLIIPFASKIIFISQELPISVSQFLKDRKIQHELLPSFHLEIPDKLNGKGIAFDMALKGDEIVVLDGYQFGIEYQKSVKNCGNKLIYIDDMGKGPFIADVVINHAPGAKYPNSFSTKFYTGLDYAILRAPFFNRHSHKSNDKKIAFISLGGSDYFEFSLKLLDLINQNGGFDSINLLYSSNYSVDSIKRLHTYKSNVNLNLYANLNAEQLVKLLDESTHAFVSASTVLLESYSRGLLCYVGFYSKNQKMIYDGFVKNKLAVGMGHFSALDSKLFNTNLNCIPTKLIKPLRSANSIIDIFKGI